MKTPIKIQSYGDILHVEQFISMIVVPTVIQYYKLFGAAKYELQIKDLLYRRSFLLNTKIL